MERSHHKSTKCVFGVNEKADLMELSTKEMIIRFVFESVSKDPNRLLPLLKNHKVEPPMH